MAFTKGKVVNGISRFVLPSPFLPKKQLMPGEKASSASRIFLKWTIERWVRCIDGAGYRVSKGKSRKKQG